MNICFVSREYPTDDHAGGIGTYTEKTARGLARLGQNVVVITETQGGGSTRMEDGVAVVRLPPPQKRPGIVWRARAVAHALEQLPRTPDVVQACEYRAEAFWYALHRHGRTKLVTRLATPSVVARELNSQARHGERRERLVIDPLERLQTRHSDAVISLSDALADRVSERWHLPRERITTIMNGVDFAERYQSQAAPLPLELRDKEYLIYFGRLEERKGVHVLARALPRLLASYPHLHMVFVGRDLEYMGKSMRFLIELCNSAYLDRLHFFPRLPPRELYPLLQHARCAVLPSLWEALGNVCLEALDMGKPVVATEGSGFGEVIEHGRSGLLVPPGDVQALQQALLGLLADRARLDHMTLAAQARARHFSLARMTRQLSNFYESLLAHPAGRTAPVASYRDLPSLDGL